MIEAFPQREALFDAAAALIADSLTAALAVRGRAGAVLTGGSTVGPIYDRLAKAPVDWREVGLTLSDERWVGATDELSNERLIRSRLLVGAADQAGFVGLRTAAPDLDAGERAAERIVGGLFPTDITLLGMGEDGHVASLFPGDPILPVALDPAEPRRVVSVPMAGLAPFVPRLSLTLSALLATSCVLLVVTGGAKRVLIERVLADSAYDPPVAALIRQARVPIRIYWAP
jgi:6-phosphogluconolactonase